MLHKFFGNIRKRVYKSLWASYMVVFFLSIIICFALFMVTLASAGKMYAGTGLISVTQLQNIIDTKLKDIDIESREVLTSQRLSTAKSYAYPFNARQIYNIKLLRELLTEEVGKNELVKEIYVHLDNSDCVLTSQNLYHGEDFAQTVKNDLFVDYDTFMEQLIFDGMSTYYISKNGRDTEYYMMRKLTMNRPGRPSKATVVIRIDQSAFAEIFRTLSEEKECTITVEDSNKNVIMGSSEGYADSIVVSGNDVDYRLYAKALLSTSPITFVCSSEVTDWTYYFTLSLDNSAILRSIRILMGCFIVSVIFGLLLCHLFVTKQYSPVEQIINNLEISEENAETDEYTAINTQIEKLRSRSERADKYSEKYYKLYRKKILTDLLCGDNVDIIKQMMRNDAELFPLQSDCFVVLAMFTTKLPDSPVRYGGINHMEMLQNSIKDMMSDYFSDSAYVYTVTMNRVLYILINPYEDKDPMEIAGLYSDLYEIINEIREYILQSLSMSVSAAVSNLRHSLKHINDAYLEAEEVRKCISANPHFSPVLCYNQMAGGSISPENEEDRDDEIVKYVKENYTDPDLSLKMLSGKFNLSMPYISRIFKKNTGSALSDYIHLLRLALAKDLLATDMTLNDIAEKCGYNNSLTLIRSFKRYEGLTPTEYKNSVKQGA